MSNLIKVNFPRFFSTDSAKAEKAQGYGHLNGINYMSPHKSGGVKTKSGKVIDLCGNASPECIKLCLGLHSGQAAMVAKGKRLNNVRRSRKRKAHYFIHARREFLLEAMLHIAKLVRKANKLGLIPVVRMNGSTDLSYENYRIMLTTEQAALLSKISGLIVPSGAQTVMSAFPVIQFVDYTKHTKRFDHKPANLNLTFSRSEINHDECIMMLRRGYNVAVVSRSPRPQSWHGYPTLDGDLHDLRYLDPKGCVVWLSPKGNRAKKHKGDFVLDLAA